MNIEYRGYEVRLSRTNLITAEIVEIESGVPLPTCVSASISEGQLVCLKRAKKLIDQYLYGAAASQEDLQKRAG